MEDEKYGVVLSAETSQFKQSLNELSKMVQSFGEEVEKINHIPINLNLLNKREATDGEVFEETQRYLDLTRKIEKAQSNLDKYNNKINQLTQDIEELAVESEKAFQLAEQLKAFDFKAEQGESFDTAEGLMYAQLDKDRNKIMKDEQKYYDATQTNEAKMNELIQQRIIAEQQLNALKEKRNKEIESNTTEKQLEQEKNSVEQLKQSYEKLQQTSSKSTLNLGNLFDKSIAKIKRFTFYLLGARSVFSLFMKYQSVYYQYNEQMRYQSELSQNAIALSLAPAFEFLGNMVTYASIAFAKFIELLTEVNVLSKVSTKGIRDYNKSLKETQTLISGIDEITNLTNPQNLGLASQYQALGDFQKKIAEVEKFFRENEFINNLAKTLETVWKWLEENIYPVLKKEIFPIVKDIFDFGGKTFDLITKIYDKLGLFDKVVKPIWSLIKAIIHTAEFIVDAIQDILNLDYNKLRKDFTNFKTKIKEDFGVTNTKMKIAVDSQNYDEAYEQLKDLQDMGAVEIELEFENEQDLKEFKDYINKTKKDAIDLDNSLDFTTTLTDDGKAILTFRDKTIQSIEDIKKAVAEYNAGGGGYAVGGGGTGAYGNAGTGGGSRGKTVEESIKEATDSALKFTTKSILGTTTIGIVADVVQRGISAIFGRQYADGLDYVPYDNYIAMLHKGEAVVPAQYNPTIHSQGNDYTNRLLETLIIKVDDLANRPNEFNVDGQQLARVTYPLLQAEGRNYNRNEGVSR